MPYAHDGGYVLIAPTYIQGAIPIEEIPYLKITDTANVATSGWASTLPPTSGEETVGTEHYESSSESTPSSSSSSTGSSGSSSTQSSSSSSTLSSATSSSSLDSSSSSSSSFGLSSQSSSSSSTLSSQSSSSSSFGESSSSSFGESSSSSFGESSSSSSKSLSSLSSPSTSSSSSVDSSTSSESSSSADAILRVSNSGYPATLDGNYTYSGIIVNGRRAFDKDNQYYFKYNGSQWVLTDEYLGKVVARWNPSENGYPDGLNNYYNPVDFPVCVNIFVTQVNTVDFSTSSSSSTQSSGSSSTQSSSSSSIDSSSSSSRGESSSSSSS